MGFLKEEYGFFLKIRNLTNEDTWAAGNTLFFFSSVSQADFNTDKMTLKVVLIWGLCSENVREKNPNKLCLKANL